MRVRDIDRSLEQWQIGMKDVHRRAILEPTPRERWQAVWPRGGLRRPRPWSGTRTPSDDGLRPSAMADPGP